MAGKPGNAAEIVRLKAELEDVTAERDKLKRIIISIEPAYLSQDKPAPLTDYCDEVPARILGMADMGMGEDQWLSEFGISRKTWMEWKAQYPELVETVDIGLQAALGWWQESSRRANEKGNSRFPLSVYNKRVAELEAGMTDLATNQVGDASKLVLLDLRGDPASFQAEPEIVGID